MWRSELAAAKQSSTDKIVAHSHRFKNATVAGLSLQDHRRFRGYGKQVVSVTSKALGLNLVDLLGWYEKKRAGSVEKPPFPIMLSTRTPVPPLRGPNDPPFRVADRKRPSRAA